MTLDHSVPQTWFFPNPLSGNANVFFLSFWLISEISGWKDCLGSHFFDAGRIEKIFPQLHTPTSIHPCHLPLSCRYRPLQQERRGGREGGWKGKGLRAWKWGTKREKEDILFKLSNYRTKTSLTCKSRIRWCQLISERTCLPLICPSLTSPHLPLPPLSVPPTPSLKGLL